MAQAVRSFTNVPYSVSSNTLVFTKPAGTIDGDLLFCAIVTEGTITFNTLAGWTASRSNVGSGVVIQTFYKLASGEPASYTWTATAGIRAAGKMLCISGASDVIDDSSLKANLNINNMVATDITTTAPNEVLIWCGCRVAVASTGNIQLPTNQVAQGPVNVNAGSAATTPQMGVGAAVFPNAGTTFAAWTLGQLGSSVTANNQVILHAFKDAVLAGAAAPLLSCEA